MKYKSINILALSLAVGVMVPPSTHAGLIFTIENAGVQETTVAGALTETFDSLPLGSLASYTSPTIGGTYSGGRITSSDVWGGAGGTGQYDVEDKYTTQTLSFTSGITYFGLWWSAGDPSNMLEFYDSADSLLGSYRISDITPYLSPDYLGNPNDGSNSSEYYAYLNFTTTGNSLINKVVFISDSAGGFESDNHSVFDKPIDPPGRPIPDAGSSLTLLGGAFALVGAARRIFQK